MRSLNTGLVTPIMLTAGILLAAALSAPVARPAEDPAQRAIERAEGIYGTPAHPTALSRATVASMTGSTPGTKLADVLPR